MLKLKLCITWFIWMLLFGTITISLFRVCWKKLVARLALLEVEIMAVSSENVRIWI